MKQLICFWAQADVFGSPDLFSFFFGICYNHRGMEKKYLWEFSPIGYVLNWSEKEVVLFLVFILFQDVCLPFCTSLPLMWQETVPFEHKIIWKAISLNKKKSEVQEIVLTKSMKILSKLKMTWCPLVAFILHWNSFTFFVVVPSVETVDIWNYSSLSKGLTFVTTLQYTSSFCKYYSTDKEGMFVS